MVANLVGRQIYNFKSAETGKDVAFVKLFLAWKEEGVEGQKVDIINSSIPDAYSVSVGGTFNFLFERGAKGQARLALIMPVVK